MDILRHQHCFNHAQREAVVRCPSCSRYYCRECVTEHDERMLCNHCLTQATESGSRVSRRLLEGGVLALQGLGGWLLLGYMFYLMGKALLAIPYDFHEGTIWQGNWWGKP